MSSSMRWRKGVMGRWIFMTRLLALREMTSWAWRCGHAIDVGVIVRWTGWDDEPDAGHQGRFGRGFVQRVGELFSSRGFISSTGSCQVLCVSLDTAMVLVLSALWADFSRPSRAWLSATSPSNPQSRQCELYQGLVPIPVRSSVWRDTAAGTITPTLDLMQFVIDHAVTWVPHLPKHHLPATPRTTERITPRTGQHAITVSLLRHDAIRSLDQPTQCHHQHGEQPLHLLDFARGMQPIITNTMEPFRQNRLYHPPDEGQRRDLFLLPLLGLVIVVPVPHPLPVVAQDAPQGDRGTDDV